MYLYQSLVMSRIEYAYMIYDGLNQSDANYLQRIQNYGLRAILNCDPRTHITDLHKMANLELLSERRKNHVCVQVHKGLLDESTNLLNEMFVKVSDVRERETRSSVRQDLVEPQVKLEISKRCFSYRGAVYYNSLNTNIRTSTTMCAFKE